MPLPIVLRVTGDPAPKGSARAILIAGKARLLASGSSANQRRLGSWKSAVCDAWEAAKPNAILTGPVALGAIFRLPMRKADLDAGSHPKTATILGSIVKPDLDKLLRSTLDALTAAGAFTDDAQVATIHATKVYAPPGGALGATIVLGAGDPGSPEAQHVYEAWQSETRYDRWGLDRAKQAGLAAQEERRRARRDTRKLRNLDPEMCG